MPTYKVEYHRVWVKTVEAESREEARRITEEEMSEEPDAEDYSYSIVKKGSAAINPSHLQKETQ